MNRIAVVVSLLSAAIGTAAGWQLHALLVQLPPAPIPAAMLGRIRTGPDSDRALAVASLPRTPDAEPILAGALNDRAACVRRQAAVQLNLRALTTSIPALEAAAATEPDSEVADTMTDCLRDLRFKIR